MKKILYFAMLGAIALTSCNKEQGKKDSHKGELRFTTEVLSLSKAVTESTAAVLQVNGFNAAVVNDNDKSILFNTALAYSNGVFSVPGKAYYYPADATVSAYAVYPKSESVVLNNGVASLAYSQDAGKDLIVAKAAGVSKQDDPLVLPFRHALSQVSFKVKGLDATVDFKLKTIEVTSPSSGTYHYSSSDWANLGTATAYTAYSNSGAAVSTADFQSFGEPMTFIPGEVQIRAVWACYMKADGRLIAQYDQSVNTTLVQGEHSSVNLELPNSGANELVSSVTVSPWAENERTIKMEEEEE